MTNSLLSENHIIKVTPIIGDDISEEIAREAFRLAAAKLPVLTTFVSRTAL